MKIAKLLSCLILLAPCLAQAESPADFTWRMPLNTSTNAAYYRLTLPMEAYLNTAQSNINDLRIFNAEGKSIPHARSASVGTSERSTEQVALRWFPLYSASGRTNQATDNAIDMSVNQGKDGTLIELHARNTQTTSGQKVRGYVIDASLLKRRERVQALTLNWDGNSGFQLLDIEVSDNLQDWRSLQKNVQLARLDFQGERIERRRIELGNLPGRYLRLLWRDPAVAPTLTAVDIELDSSQWRSPPLAWTSVISPAQTSLKLREGEFLFVLPKSLPVARIRLTLPPGNVLLPLEILRPTADRRYWQTLARSVAYRIDNNGREWLQQDIPLAHAGLKEFILRIDARSSQGMGTPTLQVAIEPEQVVFLAEGKAPYELAVGNAKAARSALPLATLVPGVNTENAPQIAEALVDASKSTVAGNPTATNSAVPQAETVEWKRILLWGLLVAGVLAMAAMAWHLLRQMRNAKPPTDSE